MGDAGPGPVDGDAEELSFLVGNACSRVINLLMQPEADRAVLEEELRFLADRAGRLADALEAERGSDDSG